MVGAAVIHRAGCDLQGGHRRGICPGRRLRRIRKKRTGHSEGILGEGCCSLGVGKSERDRNDVGIVSRVRLELGKMVRHRLKTVDLSVGKAATELNGCTPIVRPNIKDEGGVAKEMLLRLKRVDQAVGLTDLLPAQPMHDLRS
jgi:hypothetical protein